MADWSKPLLTDLYTDFRTFLDSRLNDVAEMFSSAPSNQPTNTIRFNRAANSGKFQQWDSAAWVDQLISVAGGGTGAATASGARTALGLGTMSTQDANAVAITGGSVAGSTIASGIVATAIDSGTIDAARLPATIVFSPGMMIIYGGAAAPSGWLLCDGTAINRITYASLFAIIGIAFGAGDGVNTFNLPDLRQRFSLGKAAAGTGSVLGSTGGAIDHTHTSAAHTHTVASHTHTGPSHTHTGPSHTHTGTTDNDNANHSHAVDINSGIESNDGLLFYTVGATTTTLAAGAADGNHYHRVLGNTATANATHSHTFTSDASGTGATGAAGTGATGGTALVTDSTAPGAGSTNNPPYQVVNFIIKT